MYGRLKCTSVEVLRGVLADEGYSWPGIFDSCSRSDVNTLIFLLNYHGEGSVQRDRGHQENVRLVGFSYHDKGFVVHEICLILPCTRLDGLIAEYPATDLHVIE